MNYAVTVTTLVGQDGSTVAICGPRRGRSEADSARVDLDVVGMAAVFKALGSPIRLHLLAVVQAAPGGEACVCELVDAVGLSQPTVSHHLAVLADAGLVRRERRGTWAWYTLRPGCLDVVRELLAHR